MLLLYFETGGSREITLLKQKPNEQWEDLRQSATRLLRARNAPEAAHFLQSIPFELWKATNYFHDNFSVLYARLPLNQYVQVVELNEKLQKVKPFTQIASTVTETGEFIRFVAIDLDTETEVPLVPNTAPEITSEVVERALLDAETLLRTNGPLSAIDRIHTSLHGYLLAICKKAAIQHSKNASITALYKLIRENHVTLKEIGARSQDINQILKSFSAIIDVLNPIRNEASIAHPNETLLGEEEAILVINAARTILHYLNSKLKQTK
jgi:abortive infection Abi-like protein